MARTKNLKGKYRGGAISSAFATPEEGLDPKDWQAAYMEQYLNKEGTEKICDVYDTPGSLF